MSADALLASSVECPSRDLAPLWLAFTGACCVEGAVRWPALTPWVARVRPRWFPSGQCAVLLGPLFPAVSAVVSVCPAPRVGAQAASALLCAALSGWGLTLLAPLSRRFSRQVSVVAGHCRVQAQVQRLAQRWGNELEWVPTWQAVRLAGGDGEGRV